MRVIVIAQARMGSSRLPGKVLREAGGRSLLAHLAGRLSRAETPTDRVVATTIEPGDDGLVVAAEALGLSVHRGPVDDVLKRFSGALEALGAAPEDVVVRVTGDCPLLDPGELDRLVREFIARRDTPDEVDYLTNQAGETRRIPRGLDVEVVSAAILALADREAREPGEREHVMPWIYGVPGRARTAVSDPPGPDLGHLRLTVDTAADLALVDAVVTALGPEATTAEVAAWLAEHPEVAALNAGVAQKSTLGEDELRRARIGGGLLLARADAGPSIGFGHVGRVSALLDAWVELGGRAAVVGEGIGGRGRERLEALGVEVVSGGDDTFEARAPHARALALDGYQFRPEQHARWRGLKPLLAVDDLAAFPMVADVVLNQNLDYPAERYTCGPETRLLVGSAYALLRREFRHAAPKVEATRRVLVTFGGADPAGLSAAVAEALLEATPAEVSVDVVVGGSVSPAIRQAVTALAAANERVRAHHDVADMAGLMVGATAAVAAAGTTTWELMACGVPAALVAVADNQRPVLEGVANNAAGVVLGWHEDLDAAGIAESVAALVADEARRRELAARGRALVDGRGALRVIDALLDAIERRQGDAA